MSLAAHLLVNPRRSLSLLALVLLLAVAQAVLASEDDKRIHLDGSLGGDVAACVDAGLNLTSDPTDAGLLLRSAEGEALFYASPEQIAAVPLYPYEATIIAQGSGSYGPVYLQRLTSGQFRLIGSNAQGEASSVTWTGCEPFAPADDGQSGNLSLTSQLVATCIAENGARNISPCQDAAAALAPVCAAEALDAQACVAAHFL